MKNSWLIPVTTLVLGAAGGFFSGKNVSSAASDVAAGEVSNVNTRSGARSARAEATGASAASKAKRAASVEEISRIAGNSARIQALVDFYGGLSASQLEDEARKLEELPMRERMMASFVLFGRWAEVDPKAAMTFSNTMGFTGMFVRPTILQSWASVDPVNAAAYYTANPREFAMGGMMGGGRGPMGGQSSASIIASEWARQDPQAAITWANTLGTEKGQALNAILGEVAKTDPKKAVTMLATMDGVNLEKAYSTVAAKYGAANFSEAQAWIRTLPADQQANALAAAISGLSNQDPEAASRQVANMPAGDARNKALADVVKDWAFLNPGSAGEFLKTQGGAEISSQPIRELMPVWVGQNPAAALTFANSLTGNSRDTALQSYVWSNRTASPTELVKVAESITDEKDRSRTIGVAAARWMAEDEVSAKSYIQQTPLMNDQTKQRILQGGGMWDGGQGGR